MNIGIFYSREPKGDKPDEGALYVDYPQWRNYPHELLGAITTTGAKAVVVCLQNTYAGGDTFSQYWLPDPDEVGNFKVVREPIKLDAIFDKGYFRAAASLAMVNVPE